MTTVTLGAIDRKIINGLQGGFPVCEPPYRDAASKLGLDQESLIERLDRMLADGVLSRFGPMYNAENLGGAVTLCAMQVPQHEFDEVAEQVNQHLEVAHNYERGHALNMWFVLAATSRARIDAVATEAE